MFGKKKRTHNNYLGGDSGDRTNYTPPAKSCGYCGGNGGRHNRAGRPVKGTRCPQCRKRN